MNNKKDVGTEDFLKSLKMQTLSDDFLYELEVEIDYDFMLQCIKKEGKKEDK